MYFHDRIKAEIQLIKEEHEKDQQLDRLTLWRRDKLRKLIVDQQDERAIFERNLALEREERERKTKELERSKMEVMKFKEEKGRLRMLEDEEEKKQNALLEEKRKEELKVVVQLCF